MSKLCLVNILYKHKSFSCRLCLSGQKSTSNVTLTHSQEHLLLNLSPLLLTHPQPLPPPPQTLLVVLLLSSLTQCVSLCRVLVMRVNDAINLKIPSFQTCKTSYYYESNTIFAFVCESQGNRKNVQQAHH